MLTALVLLFFAAFSLHPIFGTEQYNSQLAERGIGAVSTYQYLFSSDFWFSNFQTWEAEFFVLGVFVIFTIYLRQKGSTESKPVSASNKTTGTREE